MNTFDIFSSRTVLKATLTMQTALSVGSRSPLDPTGSDLPVMKGRDGMPFIPGSSIKGVIRSQMERVLRSLPPGYDLIACDPLTNPCLSREKINEIQNNLNSKTPKLSPAEYETAYSKAVWDGSCTICRLFGSQSFSSHLFFKDACMLNDPQEAPYLTQVRDGVGIDRDLGAAKTNIKYDFEVVVPGVQFDIEILAENVEPWEIGLLLSVLRFWENGSIAIGGKSTRGPGWGKLEALTIQRVDQPDLLNYLTSGTINTVENNTFVQAFQAKVAEMGGTHA